MGLKLEEIEITDTQYSKEPTWVIKKNPVVPGDETPFYLVKRFPDGGMVELEYLGPLFGKGNTLIVSEKELEDGFSKARIIGT